MICSSCLSFAKYVAQNQWLVLFSSTLRILGHSVPNRLNTALIDHHCALTLLSTSDRVGAVVQAAPRSSGGLMLLLPWHTGRSRAGSSSILWGLMLVLPWDTGRSRAGSASILWGLMQLLPWHTGRSRTGSASILWGLVLVLPWHTGRSCAGSASILWGLMLLLPWHTGRRRAGSASILWG
jgi:hypothetical protein